jgi:hypothetical protein
MERALLGNAVAHDAQPRRLGLFNDPPMQRRDLDRLSLVLRSPDPLVSPGSRLKRPADKLECVLYAGAVLYRGAQRPVRQIGQPVQAGARHIGIVHHAPHNSTTDE